MLCQGTNGCGCAIQSTTLSISGSGTGVDPWNVDLLGGAFTGSFYNFASSTERTANLPSPSEGDLSWLRNTNVYEFYNGSAWIDLAGQVIAYTPVFSATTTSPNLGSTGTTEGWYSKVGDVVYYQFMIRFAGTGVTDGSGTYHISVPFTPKSITNSSLTPRGLMRYVSIGSGNSRDYSLHLNPSIEIRFMNATAYGSNLALTNSTMGVTGGFNAGDLVSGQVTYHAA